jgi:hypothetical protein
MAIEHSCVTLPSSTSMQTSWQLLLTKRAGGERLRVLFGRHGGILQQEMAMCRKWLFAGDTDDDLWQKLQVTASLYRGNIAASLLLPQQAAANYFTCKAKPACLLVSYKPLAINAAP